MVSIVPFSSSLDFIKVWNVFMKSLAFLSYLFISCIFKPAFTLYDWSYTTFGLRFLLLCKQKNRASKDV